MLYKLLYKHSARIPRYILNEIKIEFNFYILIKAIAFFE